jgi:ribonuclease BN (tRNA processing enzyme)
MKNSKLSSGKIKYTAQNCSKKPSLLALMDGDAKDFYKALFRLNLLLDIHIDEEDFHRPEDEEGSAIDRRLIFELIGGSLEDANGGPKTIIKDMIKSILQDIRKRLHRPTFSIDSELQDVWKRYLKNIDNISNSYSTKKQSIQLLLLRLKGICLLLIVKYARAMLQVDIPKEDLYIAQDAVTRFASASLSHVISGGSKSEKNESVYLQVLLFLECASCASSDSSIGFIRLAESVAREKQGDELEDVFKEIFPYYKSLLDYNLAIAYNHASSGQRPEALERTICALNGIQDKINELQAKDEIVYKSELADLRLYLEMPLLKLRADILNKMQFCFNANKVLLNLKASAESVHKVRIGTRDVDGTYKQLRAHFLEATCWLDMGDRERARKAITEASRIKGNDHTGRQYLRKEVQKSLSSVVPQNNHNLFERGKRRETLINLQHIDDLKNILGRRPALHTNAIELIFQYNLEVCRSRLQEKDLIIDQKLIGILRHNILGLKKFIEFLSRDRFMRQNLKELALDWLDVLKNLKIKRKGIEQNPLMSNSWRNAVLKVLECLDSGSKDNPEEKPYKREGNIANEIWGESFKIFDRFARERLFKILSDLNDNCEGFFHSKQHDNSIDRQCNYSNEKKFLEHLVKFEFNSLGLEEINGNVDFQDYNTREKEGTPIYPERESYGYRRAIRRGRLLLSYIECLGKGKDECTTNCFGHLRDTFTWLENECTSGNDLEAESIHVCLQHLRNAWSKRTDLNKETLRLDDYRQIIADSDFNTRLEPGRSEQPVHFIEKKKGVEFVALRRWNSYTPELSFSKGGGYFVFVPSNGMDGDSERLGGTFCPTLLGVVVDPGFDFIHNFFKQGFTLDDIDIVIITHADSDHINDFGGLADLLRERTSRMGKEGKKIYTFMPLNAQRVLDRYITAQGYRHLYYDTILVDADGGLHKNKDRDWQIEMEFVGKEEENITYNRPLLRPLIKQNKMKGGARLSKKDLHLTIRPVAASHDDHAGERPGSFGYVLKFQGQGKNHVDATIGFTGDSQWFPEFATNFKNCDLVCSHMGSIFGDKEKDYKEQRVGQWEALIRKKNHPYLPGEILFIEQIRKLGNVPERIIVLSEFGEEMKGLMRIDLCERLNRCLSKNPDGCWDRFAQERVEKRGKNEENRCGICEEKLEEKTVSTIPADIGLRISVFHKERPQIHCVMCDRFGDPDNLEWVPYGSEEALFYVCGPCHRSKTQDVLTAKYKSIIEDGRMLRRAPKQDNDVKNY